MLFSTLQIADVPIVIVSGMTSIHVIHTQLPL